MHTRVYTRGVMWRGLLRNRHISLLASRESFVAEETHRVLLSGEERKRNAFLLSADLIPRCYTHAATRLYRHNWIYCLSNARRSLSLSLSLSLSPPFNNRLFALWSRADCFYAATRFLRSLKRIIDRLLFSLENSEMFHFFVSFFLFTI